MQNYCHNCGEKIDGDKKLIIPLEPISEPIISKETKITIAVFSALFIAGAIDYLTIKHFKKKQSQKKIN